MRQVEKSAYFYPSMNLFGTCLSEGANIENAINQVLSALTHGDNIKPATLSPRSRLRFFSHLPHLIDFWEHFRETYQMGHTLSEALFGYRLGLIAFDGGDFVQRAKEAENQGSLAEFLSGITVNRALKKVQIDEALKLAVDLTDSTTVKYSQMILLDAIKNSASLISFGGDINTADSIAAEKVGDVGWDNLEVITKKHDEDPVTVFYSIDGNWFSVLKIGQYSATKIINRLLALSHINYFSHVEKSGSFTFGDSQTSSNCSVLYQPPMHNSNATGTLLISVTPYLQ